MHPTFTTAVFLKGQSSDVCYGLLNFGTVNVNSLISKVHYINNFISVNNLHILSVTETWLTAACSTSFVNIPNFEFFRGDVLGSVRKHGAGLYVRESLDRVQVCVDLPNVVVVHLIKYDLFVLSIYRPPSFSEQENLNLMNFLLDFSVDKALVVLGDFNLPSLRWSADGASCTHVSRIDGMFRDCFIECGLTQWVDFGTFFPSGNTLELILTSDKDRILELASHQPFPGCYHVPLVCGVIFQFVEEDTSEVGEKLDWFRGDYDELAEQLQEVDWLFLFDGMSTDDCFVVFLEMLWELIPLYIPLKQPSRAGKWLTRAPRSIVRQSSLAWKAYKELRVTYGRHDAVTVQAFEDFMVVNSRYRNFARDSQSNYERKLAGLLAEAPKIFHSYLRERKVGCPSVGPLRGASDGRMITNGLEMSNEFAEAFSDVFISTDPEFPADHQLSASSMLPFEISYLDVLEVLKSTNVSSSPGPDGVHPLLLRSCAEQLAQPLAIIFQKSLSSGELPCSWKTSRVVPIFKSGSKANPLNYRPVSLSSICCKTLERLVVPHLLSYLE